MSGREDFSLLPARFYRVFLSTLNAELGMEALATILGKANLPVDLADPGVDSEFSARATAENYALIQKAIRVFYGRGARGTLIRLGRSLWTRLLESATITEKTQAQLIRTLPSAMRPRQALEFLSRQMSDKPAGVTVHTMDLDLMFVDHSTTAGKASNENHPVCYITLGLLQECLFWATAHNYDVDELACGLADADKCEFKIAYQVLKKS